MNVVVILILAVVWAVVLIPQLVKIRAERGPSDSIGAFQRQLSVLQRSAPTVPVAGPAPRALPATPVGLPVRPDGLAVHRSGGVPRTRAEARTRRKAVLVGLLAAAGATLVLGLVPALRVLLWAHLVVDVLLVAYVALLVHLRQVAEERAGKVRYLPTGGGVHGGPPPLLLRRSAN